MRTLAIPHSTFSGFNPFTTFFSDVDLQIAPCNYRTLIEGRTYKHWFVKNNISDWIKDGIWAIEHNKKANKRDSPVNYKRLQDQIDKLRILQINRPR